MRRLFPILAAIGHLACAQHAQAQPWPVPAKDTRAKAEQPKTDSAQADKPARGQKKSGGDRAAAAPKPDTVPRRIAPVPMEAFAAEADANAGAAGEPVSAGPQEPSACQIRVADKIAVIEPLPSFGGPGDCGATDVVRLQAIIQPDKSQVAVSPPATMRCSMAEALATWVREDLTATTAQLGSTPRALDNYASYDCRGRNRVAGARISEHGLANAIDVRGVHLANGRFAEFTDRRISREFREAVRKSVCARFTTVLGPGSDGHHETHIHMDLAERRGGYRLCQWNVLDPAGEVPLPRPRPKEAS
ncbi:MAG: extensin family protein [Pseudomonadota bacterium]